MLDNVKLILEEPGDKPGVRIEGHRPNSATNYIAALLTKGFRGNVKYYRDNDRRLILKVWENEGLKLTASQRELFLYVVTDAGTITRKRRQLRGEFPESQEVENKRYRLFLEKTDEHSKGTFLRRHGLSR